MPAPVLVVEWSRADFGAACALADAGELPQFSRLRASGTMTKIAVSYPTYPAILWHTAATGLPADRHGVFGEWGIDDTAQTVVPATRQAPAVWDTVRENGGTAHVCGDFGDEPEPVAVLMLTVRDIAPAVLLPFVPRAAEINQGTDNRLFLLADALAAAFTRHNHATLALESPFTLAVVRYDLIARLSPIFGAEPPESLYVGVIPGAYRLLDLFLTRLSYLAGRDTMTVLYSPHGRETEPQVYAPGFAIIHGTNGTPASTGRGTLYDLAPTVLALCGTPRTAPPTPFSPRPVTPIPNAPPLAVVLRETDWRRAQVLYETGRAAQAIPVLETLRREQSETPITLLLAQCLLATGAARDAEILLSAHVMLQDAPFVRYLLGASVLSQKRVTEGIAHLRAAETNAQNEPPAFWVRVGQAYFQVQRIGDARRAFETVTRLAPDNDAGHLGLAGCAILRRDLATAVHHAQKTLTLRPDSPFAHLILGRSYEWLSRPADAAASYEAALVLSPDFSFVHRSLAKLYDTLPDGAVRATFHRKQFRELKRGAISRH